MRQYISKRKKLVALSLTVTVALGLGAMAVAFFTSSGQGTGSETTGTSTAFKVTSTPGTSANLVPDETIGTGQVNTISYSVENEGTGRQQLANVSIQVAGSSGVSPNATATTWSAQADGSKPACTAADFSVGGAAVGTTYTASPGTMLAPGATYPGTVTLQMIDNGANQDNCKGVTVPLFIAAN